MTITLRFIFLCSLFLLQSQLVFADFLYKGYVTHCKDAYTIKDEYTNKTYKILTRTTSIWTQIQTLESGDYISGSAYNESLDQIYLTSVDFVGLKRLLGIWKNVNHVVQFEDFNNVNFWNLDSPQFWGPFHYNYTITPGDNGQWRIFFVDDDKVTLVSLTCLDNKHLKLSFYDNNTGAITKTYELERP